MIPDLNFEQLMNLSLDNVRNAEDTQPEYALIHSTLAVAYANMAIAQELKKFNDAADLERALGEVAKRAQENLDEELGW